MHYEFNLVSQCQNQEQGRPIRASVQVLEAVARTLQLDTAERQHLFRLAEVPDTVAPDDSGLRLPPQDQSGRSGPRPGRPP